MASQNDNHIQSIDRIYATALLDLAQQAGQADAVNQEVHGLAGIMHAEPGLTNLLASQVLSARHRAESIDRIFKANVSDLLYRFIQVVNEKGRLGELPKILRAFLALYEQRLGQVRVDAEVAWLLDDPQAHRIADRLGQALGRTVLLHQHQDPSLLGGLKVRIADRLIDGSVAALRMLRQKMIDAGRQKAREQGLGSGA